MDDFRPSLLREICGALAGGALASVGSGCAFLWFFDLPSEWNPDRPNYAGTVFAMIVLVMFICGGFIGRRGFVADSVSEVLPAVLGSYVAVIFLSFLASLDLSEIAAMAGFATAGIVTSAAGSILLQVPFPTEATKAERAQQIEPGNRRHATRSRSVMVI